MKKTAIILSSVICFIIFSCKKNNDDSFKDNAPLSEPLMISISNELANDKLFLEFYTNIQMEQLKIRDIQKIKNIINDNVILINEEEFILKYMGYSGKSEYVLYRDRQKNLVRHLNEKYKLSNLNPTIARQIIENAIRVNLSSSTVDKFLEDADLCERARVACLASVAAQATFMNIGCLALDPAGGIGILCHAAVLAYQTAESAQCNITAEQCKKNNSTLTIE